MKQIRTIQSINELYSSVGIAEPFSDTFDCLRYEDVADKMAKQMPASRCLFNQVCFIQEGKVTVQVNNQNLELGPGSVFVAGTGNVQSWEIKDDLRGFVLYFSDNFFSINAQQPNVLLNFPFLREGGAYLLELHKDQLATFRMLCTNILKEQVQHSQDKYEFILSYLLILLMKVRRILNSNTTIISGESHLIRQTVTKYQSLINLHIQELITGKVSQQQKIADYAKALNIHPNYLNEVVKKVLGKSAGSLFRERIAHEALIQLRQTNMSVADVSHKLGFQTTAYFSNFFKKETGYTPTQYRELLKL